MDTKSKCPACPNTTKGHEIWKCRSCGHVFCRRCGNGHYGDECPKCGKMDNTKIAYIK